MAKEGKKAKGSGACEGLREEWETDAEAFRALGDPTRLAVLAFLRRRLSEDAQPPGAGYDGDGQDRGDGEGDADDAFVGAATVGEVSCHLFGTEKVPSNLSHHLKELRRAGLITMKRRGKNVLCRLDRDALSALFARQGGGGVEPAAPTVGLVAPPALPSHFATAIGIPGPDLPADHEGRAGVTGSVATTAATVPNTEGAVALAASGIAGSGDGPP